MDEKKQEPTQSTTPPESSPDLATTSDDELAALIKAKRAAIQAAEPLPAKVNPHQALAQPAAPPKRFDAAADAERRARWTREQEPIWAAQRKQAAWKRYIAARGKRYENCRLETFIAERPDQRKAITKVRAYAANLSEHIKAGHNLLLVGSVGTGKDHLQSGLIWLAIQAGHSVEWRDGSELFSQWRDAITLKISEQKLLAPLVDADVLAISEPMPGRGPVTDFQAERLSQIIDARYARERATWITANLIDAEQFSELTSHRLVDRLADSNSVIVACNWPSFRKAKAKADG